MKLTQTLFGSQVKAAAKPQATLRVCQQRVGDGFCENPPSRDLAVGGRLIGSFCDIHYRLMLEAIGP